MLTLHDIHDVAQLNERKERERHQPDSDESTLLKAFFDYFDPEQDEELYIRTVRNFPIEHNEFKEEQEAGLR